MIAGTSRGQIWAWGENGDGQLGLKWIPLASKPTVGTELKHLKLSEALKSGRRSFAQVDLDSLGLRRGGDGAQALRRLQR